MVSARKPPLPQGGTGCNIPPHAEILGNFSLVMLLMCFKVIGKRRDSIEMEFFSFFVYKTSDYSWWINQTILKKKIVHSALSPPEFDLPFPRSNHFDQFQETYYSHTGMYLCVWKHIQWLCPSLHRSTNFLLSHTNTQLYPIGAKRSSQSILKEINPEYSLEGKMLKLQYFGHLMQRANSLEKTLMLGKIEGKRRREQQRMRWLYSITDSIDMSLNKLWDIVRDRETWCATMYGVAKSRTRLSNWTTTTVCFYHFQRRLWKLGIEKELHKHECPPLMPRKRKI